MSFEVNLIPWVSSQLPDLENRIYPGFAPEKVTKLPYVVWTLISTTSDYTHSGPVLANYSIQFSIFASTYMVAASVRDALRSLLDARSYDVPAVLEWLSFLDSARANYESDTKLHHVSVDFVFSVRFKSDSWADLNKPWETVVETWGSLSSQN